MQAFALADLSAPQGMRVISLAQNESAFPASPRAIEAARTALQNCALYPDPDWAALRDAIAGRHRIDPANVLCSAGSMDLISALIMHSPAPATGCYRLFTVTGYFRDFRQVRGRAYDAAPETDLTVDVDALLAAVTPDTRLVCIANPGNPTGTRIPRGRDPAPARCASG